MGVEEPFELEAEEEEGRDEVMEAEAAETADLGDHEEEEEEEAGGGGVDEEEELEPLNDDDGSAATPPAAMLNLPNALLKNAPA